MRVEKADERAQVMVTIFSFYIEPPAVWVSSCPEGVCKLSSCLNLLVRSSLLSLVQSTICMVHDWQGGCVGSKRPGGISGRRRDSGRLHQPLRGSRQAPRFVRQSEHVSVLIAFVLLCESYISVE